MMRPESRTPQLGVSANEKPRETAQHPAQQHDDDNQRQRQHQLSRVLGSESDEPDAVEVHTLHTHQPQCAAAALSTKRERLS
jgi:hypothetical protein